MHTIFKDGSSDVANGGIIIEDDKIPDDEISVRQYMNKNNA